MRSVEFISGYLINENGIITNKDSGRTLKYSFKNYYPRITLRGKNYYIHRLLALNFIPNPNNYPQVNHIDADTTNYKLSNLEWCTAKGNIAHCMKLGRHASQTDGSFKKQQNEKGKPSKVSRVSKSGHRGIQIYKGPEGIRYRVYCNSGGSRYLGSFKTLKEAKEIHSKTYHALYDSTLKEVE